MATRRRRGLADCNRAYMEPEENDSSEAASESDDIELIDCDVDSDEIDGSSSSDDVELKRELYKRVLLDVSVCLSLSSTFFPWIIFLKIDAPSNFFSSWLFHYVCIVQQD